MTDGGQEPGLLACWQAVSTASQPDRQQLLRESATYLQQLGPEEHWWCQHAGLTQHLAHVLKRHDGQPSVQKIWARMAEQLSACTNCVVAFHAALVRALQLLRRRELRLWLTQTHVCRQTCRQLRARQKRPWQ